MDEIVSYITIFAAILGAGYPIILQNISKLDEKYGSDHIVKFFYKESEKIWFEILLISTAIGFVIWTLKIPPLIKIDGFNFFIENSAALLVIISSCFLFTVFFLLIRKIQVYLVPDSIFKRLNKLHISRVKYLEANPNSKKKKFEFFDGLIDLFLAAIRSTNESLCLTYIRAFNEIFTIGGKSEKGLPEIYFLLVNKAIKELILLNKKKRMPAIEKSVSSQDWILRSMDFGKENEISYLRIWRNILLLAIFKREEMIFSYWERASSYYSGLKFLDIEDNIGPEEGAGLKLIKESFFEFNLIFGGLLIFQKMYSSVKSILNYTNSEPPMYFLLPKSMDSIFNWYYRFRNDSDGRYTVISSYYPFPTNEGISMDGTVKRNVYKYLAILFIRQFTLHQYYVNSDPLSLPNLPKTQRDRKAWLDEIDFFRKLVKEFLEDQYFLEEIDYGYISIDWFKKVNKPYPLEYLDDIKRRISEQFKKGETDFPISPKKKEKFINSTKSKIEDFFKRLKEIKNNQEISENYKSWFVNGEKSFYDRNAFIDDLGNDNNHYDTYLYRLFERDFSEILTNSFFLNVSKSYLLRPTEIFEAINKIKDSIENPIIISLGINLKNFIKKYMIQSLEENRHGEIPIIEIGSSFLTDPSFLILSKNDLPNILDKEIEKKLIEEYKLEPLELEEFSNVYISLIELSKEKKDFLKDLRPHGNGVDIKKSVLLCLILALEIRWRRNPKIIQFLVYSDYTERGLPNNINEVEL